MIKIKSNQIKRCEVAAVLSGRIALKLRAMCGKEALVSGF
jgi:hypothetical protein